MGINDEEMEAIRPVALRGGATENGGGREKAQTILSLSSPFEPLE